MLWNMRTTVRLDSGLMRAAKRLATDTGRTFTALIEDALREAIARSKAAPVPAGVALPLSKHRGGLLIDLDNSAAVAELLDEDIYVRLRR